MNHDCIVRDPSIVNEYTHEDAESKVKGSSKNSFAALNAKGTGTVSSHQSNQLFDNEEEEKRFYKKARKRMKDIKITDNSLLGLKTDTDFNDNSDESNSIQSTEEREKSKVSSSVYHLKQYDNGNHLAKLSILPTCKTMETLLGSSEDSSEDVSSASSFYEQNENVPDRSHEDVLSVIFPIDDNSAKPAKLREPSTYYRDLIVKMDGGSLFTMSPRSFLSGKKD